MEPRSANYSYLTCLEGYGLVDSSYDVVEQPRVGGFCQGVSCVGGLVHLQRDHDHCSLEPTLGCLQEKKSRHQCLALQIKPCKSQRERPKNIPERDWKNILDKGHINLAQ